MGSSLDRKLYSFFKKRLLDSALELTGNLKVATGVVDGMALRIHKAANTEGTMKIHCHQLADPGEDYTINDFKGEALHVANGMIGIGSSWVLDANSAGSLYCIMATAFLGSGHTLSASGSMTGVSGGIDITAGTVNGSGVILTGVIGGMAQGGGTITLCKYVSAIWASSMLQVTPTAGESQLLLMTCGNAGATLNQVIYIDAGDKISEFLHLINGATMSATRATPNSTAVCDGYLKCTVGTKTLYIPLYNACTIA